MRSMVATFGCLVATMVAMIAAMIYSAIKLGRISPLLWFSGVMVVVLGSITIWLNIVSFFIHHTTTIIIIRHICTY